MQLKNAKDRARVCVLAVLLRPQLALVSLAHLFAFPACQLQVDVRAILSVRGPAHTHKVRFRHAKGADSDQPSRGPGISAIIRAVLQNWLDAQQASSKRLWDAGERVRLTACHRLGCRRV